MPNNRKTYNEMYIPLIALLVALVMMISFVVGLLKFPRVVVDVENSSEISTESSLDVVESSDISDDSLTENASVTEDKETTYYKNFDFVDVSVSNREVANGCLAVIKETNKYFPIVGEDKLLNIYANKTPQKYDLSGVALDVQESAFSSFDSLFVKYSESVGTPKIIVKNAYLNNGAASNGSLDLSTGFSLEINSIPDEKVTFLREQSYKYGIIQRYPSGKDMYTGYAADSSVYRYVGAGHSYYMNYYKYCLEEYLDKIRIEKIIEFKSGIENNIAYVVYYVPMNSLSDTTTVSVPTNENCSYEISGDGSEGFIVTVKITQ